MPGSGSHADPNDEGWSVILASVADYAPPGVELGREALTGVNLGAKRRLKVREASRAVSPKCAAEGWHQQGLQSRYLVQRLRTAVSGRLRSTVAALPCGQYTPQCVIDCRFPPLFIHI